MDKILKFLLMFLVTGIGIKAQQFKIDTIQYKGSDKNLINLVILGDGYTKEELKYYQEDARRFSAYFFETEPFRQYQNYFNIYAIQTISEESGAIHKNISPDCPKEHFYKLEDLPHRFNQFKRDDYTPTTNPNTIFGSTFDSWGIHRLVVPQNTAKIKEVLSSHIPNYAQVVVLVNSPYYGGSGGEFATATVNFKSNDIAVHELGHSFGQLSDEYFAGVQYASENVNFTQNAADVPWKHWLGTNDIGVYAYADKGVASKWFRPHEYCKMQYLIAPFCSVCQEVFVEKIHDKTNPILSVKPDHTKKVEAKENQLFAVKLAKPSPNTLKVNWFLNDQPINQNRDSIYVNKGMLQAGLNKLRVEVKDTTDLVRTEKHHEHIYAENWEIENNVTASLEKPISTWGNSLEACYDGQQMITIKNPQPTFKYLWFDSIDSKNPIAITSNFMTPKLKKETAFYVQAQYNGLESERVQVMISVLDEIKPIKKVKTKTKNGITFIQLVDAEDPNIKYEWFDENNQVIYKSRSANEHYFSKQKESSNKLELDANFKSKIIEVQKINKQTTCKGERFKIVL